MRIGLICTAYTGMKDGIGDYLASLAAELVRHGQTVRVITSQAADMKSIPGLNGKLQVHPVMPGWGFHDASRLFRSLDEFRPDVINIHYPGKGSNWKFMLNALPLWARSRLDVPVITTIHEFHIAHPLRKMSVLPMALFSNGLSTPSQAEAAALKRVLGRGLPPISCVPVGSSIPVSPVTSEQIQTIRRGIGAEGRFLIGYFGFISKSKGMQTLLESAGLFAKMGGNPHLLVIGEPQPAGDLQPLKAMANSVGPGTERVHWAGYCDATRTSQLLSACDAILLPFRDGASLRRTSLITSLEHGRAVITSAGKAPPPELKHGGNVLLFPAERSDEAARALKELSGNDALSHRLRKGAKELSWGFSWERIAEQMLRVYQEAARN